MKHYFILMILLFEVFSGYTQTTYPLNAVNIGILRDSAILDIRTDRQVYFRLKRGTNYRYFVEGVDFAKYSLIVNNKDTVLFDKNSNNFTFPSLPGFNVQDLATLIKEFGLKIVSPDEIKVTAPLNIQSFYDLEGHKELLENLPVDNATSKTNKCDSILNINLNKFLKKWGVIGSKTIQDLEKLNLDVVRWVEQVSKARYLINSSSGINLKIDSIFKEFIININLRKRELFILTDSVNSSICQPCIVSGCVKSKDSLLRSNINLLAKHLDELGKFMNLDSLAKFMNMEQLARNSRPEAYYSLPQYFNGEAKEIHIDLVPREPFYGPKYSTMIKIEEKGKPYFGYSSGIFMSLLKNHNYTLVTDTFIKKSYLTNEGNSFLFGVQAMVHMGWYIKDSDLSFQLGIGPTLSLAKPINPGIFIGGGLGIGRKDKLMINLGMHTSIVRRKSNIFEFDPVNGKYKFDGIVEDGYVSKVRTNLAFSIGYLFY